MWFAVLAVFTVAGALVVAGPSKQSFPDKASCEAWIKGDENTTSLAQAKAAFEEANGVKVVIANECESAAEVEAGKLPVPK